MTPLDTHRGRVYGSGMATATTRNGTRVSTVRTPRGVRYSVTDRYGQHAGSLTLAQALGHLRGAGVLAPKARIQALRDAKAGV